MAMTSRQLRQGLWLLAAAAATGSAAIWSLSLLQPCQVPQAGSAPVRQIGRAAPPLEAVPLELADFQRFWRLDLQRPLYDPPPPTPAPEPPPPPPTQLKLRLLGTILEPGRTQAMVMTATGEIELVRLGQTLEQATIEQITKDSIVVRHHGRQLTLEIQEN